MMRKSTLIRLTAILLAVVLCVFFAGSRLRFVGQERPDFGRFWTPADLISTTYPM
jgi:hypothetical protein